MSVLYSAIPSAAGNRPAPSCKPCLPTRAIARVGAGDRDYLGLAPAWATGSDSLHVSRFTFHACIARQPPEVGNFYNPLTILTRLFHTLERRVRARGLQQGCALVGRVPSRGALLAFPSESELSRLSPGPHRILTVRESIYFRSQKPGLPGAAERRQALRSGENN